MAALGLPRARQMCDGKPGKQQHPGIPTGPHPSKAGKRGQEVRRKLSGPPFRARTEN